MARQDQYTQLDKKNELYSDFLTDLNPHPETKDVVRFTNENAVKRSIKNLILTNRYERFFEPSIGADINRILFEPIGATSAELLRNYIMETINNYEPRCKLIDVSIYVNEERHMYSVSIIFAIINKQDPVKMELNLYRVR